jgi:hypothetical protein
LIFFSKRVTLFNILNRGQMLKLPPDIYVNVYWLATFWVLLCLFVAYVKSYVYIIHFKFGQYKTVDSCYKLLNISHFLKHSSYFVIPRRKAAGDIEIVAVRPSVRHFCPEHISKSIWGINLKLHSWIDHIEEECTAQEW